MPNNIASERTRLGMTQRDLSKQLNVSVNTVGKWESGAISPRSSKLIEMADLFHCSIDYLVGRSDERNVISPSAA